MALCAPQTSSVSVSSVLPPKPETESTAPGSESHRKKDSIEVNLGGFRLTENATRAQSLYLSAEKKIEKP